MVEIKEKLPGVELKRTEVQADAAVAEGEAAECLAGKQSVEADLSVAMPALNAAIKVCLTEERDFVGCLQDEVCSACANLSVVMPV